MSRYYEILGAKDAWSITDDATESDDAASHNNDVRPTVSARQLKALVEQVTDRYSPLPNFTHRTRFLIDAQIPLLEGYHSRISSSLDAFESLSSSLVRAVPGALGTASNGNSGGRLTAGVEGIMRLCKALISARYISTAMDVWGEDLVRSSGYIANCNQLTMSFSSFWSFGPKLTTRRLSGLEQKHTPPSLILTTHPQTRTGPFLRSSCSNMKSW